MEFAIINGNVERMSFAQLVVASAQIDLVAVKYESLGMQKPDELVDLKKTVDQTLKDRRRDQLALDLKRAQQKRDGLRSAEEKRAAADAEIARLESELGLAQNAASAVAG